MRQNDGAVSRVHHDAMCISSYMNLAGRVVKIEN